MWRLMNLVELVTIIAGAVTLWLDYKDQREARICEQALSAHNVQIAESQYWHGIAAYQRQFLSLDMQAADPEGVDHTEDGE